MATQTKVVSGNTTTYTITDEKSAAMTVTVVAVPGQLPTAQFAGSAVLFDAQQMLVTLLQLLSTGIVP